MFSNELLNKMISSEDQTTTPEFNRYCDINQNVINQVARSVPYEQTANQNGSSMINQQSIWKKNNHTILVYSPELEQNNHSDSLLGMGSSNFENACIKIQTQNQEINKPTQQIMREQQSEGNEFMQLKNQMFTIESLATKEISRLKAEVIEKDEQIEKLIDVIQMMKQQQQTHRTNQIQAQFGEIGTNTDNDYKNEEIKSLKQALVRHIRINKELTKKLGYRQNPQNDKNVTNLNQSIQKLVSKINI